MKLKRLEGGRHRDHAVEPFHPPCQVPGSIPANHLDRAAPRGVEDIDEFFTLVPKDSNEMPEIGKERVDRVIRHDASARHLVEQIPDREPVQFRFQFLEQSGWWLDLELRGSRWGAILELAVFVGRVAGH